MLSQFVTFYGFQQVLAQRLVDTKINTLFYTPNSRPLCPVSITSSNQLAAALILHSNTHLFKPFHVINYHSDLNASINLCPLQHLYFYVGSHCPPSSQGVSQCLQTLFSFSALDVFIIICVSSTLIAFYSLLQHVLLFEWQNHLLGLNSHSILLFLQILKSRAGEKKPTSFQLLLSTKLHDKKVVDNSGVLNYHYAQSNPSSGLVVYKKDFLYNGQIFLIMRLDQNSGLTTHSNSLYIINITQQRPQTYEFSVV